MKERITIAQLMKESKGDPQALRLIYNLIKNHPYFKGNRRELYKKIVKYKKN